MQQGQLVELTITDLNQQGEGVGKIEGKVVFVPDTVIGDRLLVRLLQVKKNYSYGKIEQILLSSPHRIRPRCIVADKCGGCQWQHIDNTYQQVIKQQHLQETLKRIGGFTDLQIPLPLLASSPLGYRNKATYPLALSSTQQVQAGYHRRGTHKLVNLNQCPVQDSRLNPLLAEIKQDLQTRGWSIYNESTHQGQLRHLSLRIGRRTGEILLTLVSTNQNLPGLETQAQQWLKRYDNLVGVTLNLNPAKTNVIFGEETLTIAGRGYLREIFAGLEFHLLPETFFQINTETAEALLEHISKQLKLKGDELLIDAYCGVGTFSLPLAKQVAEVIGIEVQARAITQAKANAQLNHLTNTTFLTGSVGELLPQLDRSDVVLIDPPRQGCDRPVLETLLNLAPPRIVYISCQPATLARDLKILCASGIYRLISLQPADFFPQTPHIESVAFLELS